jgi:hypothetical protein
MGSNGCTVFCINIPLEIGKYFKKVTFSTFFSIKMLVNTDVRDSESVRASTSTLMDKILPILKEFEQFYCSLIRQDIREAVSVGKFE